ncbi:MAG: class I SAM-dependent methyltransferase [Anaerolineae bacterium]|nr:class I SAM-dependent methyltransferase [Anaerolineae bacterium]
MEPEAYDELHQLEVSHWWYAGMRAITNRLIENVWSEKDGWHILDAGCGTGGNLQELGRYGTTIGFDYSPLALKYTQQKYPDKAARASVEALPYPNDTFDLVTSFDVICVHEVGDDRQAIREFARVTRKNGYVLIRVPALPVLRGPHDIVVHGIRRYTAGELRCKLTEAGLEVMRITYANSILLPLVFVSRQMQNLAVKLGAKPASDVGQSSRLPSSILQEILTWEARWIGSGHGFPAGVSLFGLARKSV